MRRRVGICPTWALGLIAPLALISCKGGEQTTSGSFAEVTTSLEILFVGNSFTNGGPIPDLVAEAATEAGYPTPSVTNISRNGRDLSFHTGPVSMRKIRKTNWDVVVLQEYSTKPTEIGDPDQFKADATYLYNEIQANSGAMVVLYETWARHQDHSIYEGDGCTEPCLADRQEMQDQLNFHYHDAENILEAIDVGDNARLAPAGETWHATYLDGDNYGPPEIRLHGSDDYHAGTNGYYVNALAIFSTIYDDAVCNISSGLGLAVAPADGAYLRSWVDTVTGATCGGSYCGDGTCDPGEDPCTCADCTPAASETSCTDGVDNDCDSYLDCADSECSADPACQCVAPGGGQPCTKTTNCCSGVGNCTKGGPSTRVCN